MILRKRKLAKKKERKARSFTLPLAPIVGLGAGLSVPIQDLMAGNYKGAIEGATRNYTGYDPVSGQWNASYLWNGAVPLLIGILVHKIASKLGVNRVLGQAGVPIIRI